jgi:hypothetical protein
VILNRVLCPDGKYRAVDWQDLMAQRYAASAVADRVLMERMARMGFDVRLNADGTARELTLVRQDVKDVFSTRRQQVNAATKPQVERFIATYGREPTSTELANMKTAAQQATRAAKTHGGETAEEIVDRMQARLAAETGYTLDGLGEEVRAHVEAGPVAGEVWSPDAVLKEAVAACAQRSATWGRANLINEIELRLPVLGLDDDQVPVLLNTLADIALGSHDVVQVTGHESGAYAAPSATRYAASDTLAAETALRRAAIERGRHALAADQVQAWMAEHARALGADQQAAAAGIATSDAALTVLVGPAGAGKSFTAGTLAAAWGDLTEGQGRVVGLAVSEIATKVLQDDGISASRNVSQWLAAQDRLSAGAFEGDDGQWQLRERDVVMVDEASMISTAQLDAIRARVDAAGARLVLTGDPRQLAAVEAGGVMDLLDGHAETYTLTDIRRFGDDWEREASLRLRSGDPDALVDYDRHARLHGVDTLDDAVTAAARAAVADRLDGRSTVVVAVDNDLAAQISSQIRDHLIELGQVQSAGVLLGRDGNTGGIGDVVMCRRNDHRIGVTNRAQYRVLDVTHTGALLLQPLTRSGQETAGADPIEVPAGYVATDVQLGYAGTVHATQGITVDNSYFVADGAAGPAAQYVALTRGRQRNSAFVALTTGGHDGETAPQATTDKGGLVRIEAETVRPTALSVLEAGLTRNDPAQLAATVAAERDHELQASMTTIAGQLDAETRLACRNRLERHLDDLTHDGVLPEHIRARLAADQGTEYLSRLIRAVEQTGKDARQVLTDAVSNGKALDNADSVAQVLSYRINAGQPVAHPISGTELAADITPAERERLAGLLDRADERARDLGARVADEAPDWAVQSLGPVPDAAEAADRADWEHRAGLVAAHREAVGWTHPQAPLGQLPGTTTTERRTSYVAAWQALGRPAERLTEAEMSEGRLRARHRAWENAQAWAPPNVDPALREAEETAENARQAAALADAEGRAEDAEQLRAQAQDAALRVQTLTEAADARGRWLADVAETQVNGEAADDELHARGITLGDEPDRTTAEEWLAAEAEARAADDEHRPITEADLRDHVRAAEADWSLPEPRSPELAADLPRPEPIAMADEPIQEPLPGLEPRRRTGSARTVLGPSIGARQLEALAATTALTTAITADRISEQAAHEQSEQESRAIEAAEAGRRRREAAELDEGLAAGKNAADQGLDFTNEPHFDALGLDDEAGL